MGATLDGRADYQVQRSVSDLENRCRNLEARVATLEQQLANLPHVPTLAEIQQALSANGTNPLNLTGLTGAPSTSTSTP